MELLQALVKFLRESGLLNIFQKSTATIFLLILLHFYLKAMLFGPLAKVQKARDALTKGARQTAGESLASAEQKTAEYEAKLREARGEVYREQEEMRRQWLVEQSQQIDATRERHAAAVRAAKDQLTREAGDARKSLAETSGTLADQIASSILNRRAS
jgi:F-type H+-transporting ATPase subunit b